MSIKKIQDEPHPVWEAPDEVNPNEVIDFLQGEGLPESMSFSYQGNLTVFRTKSERIQWTFGFQAGLVHHVR